MVGLAFCRKIPPPDTKNARLPEVEHILIHMMSVLLLSLFNVHDNSREYMELQICAHLVVQISWDIKARSKGDAKPRILTASWIARPLLKLWKKLAFT
jgi:hypothetical protein